MKQVAVVILNWNGKALLEQYLPSVVKYSPNADIIVADNASSDDSLSFLAENYPHIRVVQNDKNYGFAEGYNKALESIENELILLLNSDIEVTENWLDPLVEVMKDETIAGCQPKIASFNDKGKFEHAGASGGFIDRNYFPFCRGRIFDHVEEDKAQYDDTREIFWASGAALLIRNKLFKEVGGFDSRFFAHMEEIDLCWRIKSRSFRFLVVPESTVYHLGGGTLPYSSPKKVYLNFRNSLMMLIKNHEGLLLPKLFWRMSLDGIAGLRFLLRGEFAQVAAVWRAHMYQYLNLRSLLKSRRELKKLRSNPNNAGLFMGNIIWNYYIKKAKVFKDLNQRLFIK